MFPFLFSNANVTHTVILRPLSPGLYNMSWAKLTYDTGVDGIVQVRHGLYIFGILKLWMFGNY